MRINKFYKFSNSVPRLRGERETINWMTEDNDNYGQNSN